jgi:hypothetical protein
MLPRGYEYQSETARRYYREGSVTTAAANVLAFLEARGIAVTNDQRERITGCEDLDTLNSWVRKAATITSADELFTE